jgi:hypothetical protein
MDFKEISDYLNSGHPVQRESDLTVFVFKQIPTVISQDIIPKMQSVPQMVKMIMRNRSQPLTYRNQYAIVNDRGEVDSWAPSVEDLFAEDWIVVSV